LSPLQESILLQRALAAANPEQETPPSLALHNIVAPLRALGRYAEANDAVNEMNQGRALEYSLDAPNFRIRFTPPSFPPLPFFLVKSSPPVAEHPGADASFTPVETSTNAPFSHIPPTNATRPAA
jgi:hypothetical protein